MAYSRKSQDQTDFPNEEDQPKRKGNFRTKKDNPYLKASQILDIEKYVDDKTINVVDADTLAFQVASSVEEDYIEVYHTASDKLVATLKNITAFKGRSTKTLDPKSWLGNFNIKQEARSRKLYQVEDFTIVPKKKLKHETGATIDDIVFTNTEEVAKYYVDSWVDAIQVQTTVQKTLLVLGEGKVHRHDLLLPEPYKDGRDNERPVLLKFVRDYMINNFPSKMAPKGFEADEVVDSYGKKGYNAYKDTGVFKYIKSSPDKDAGNKEGILFNYDKSFSFKVPQPLMIKREDECVGELALDGDKIRGVGLKHMVYQLLLGDSADHYHPRKYLPKEVKPEVQYGVAGFFKECYALSTQKEVLQLLVDKYYEWFPEGIAYTAWNEEQAEFDTLGYLEMMFACAYMKDSPKDDTKLEESLIKFGVDYLHLKGNRITDETELVEESILKTKVHEAKAIIAEALTGLEKKSGTKPVLVNQLEETEAKLREVEEKLRSMFDTGA